MEEDFVIKVRSTEENEDKSVVMSLRIDRDLQMEYDKLSAQSDRSRNELMCRALEYALHHVKIEP